MEVEAGRVLLFKLIAYDLANGVTYGSTSDRGALYVSGMHVVSHIANSPLPKSALLGPGGAKPSFSMCKASLKLV